MFSFILVNQNLSRLHFSLLPRVSQIMHGGEYNLTRTRNATPTWFEFAKLRGFINMNTLKRVSGVKSEQRTPLLPNGTITFTRPNAISKILPWRSDLYTHCRMYHSKIGPNKQHPHCHCCERNGTTEN